MGARGEHTIILITHLDRREHMTKPDKAIAEALRYEVRIELPFCNKANCAKVATDIERSFRKDGSIPGWQWHYDANVRVVQTEVRVDDQKASRDEI